VNNHYGNHEQRFYKNIVTNGTGGKITMQHYDEADCCEKSCEEPSPKQLRKDARRLLKQAARIEKQRKADRKAKKAAIKADRKRGAQIKADRETALAVFREVAADELARSADRSHAAEKLLIHSDR